MRAELTNESHTETIKCPECGHIQDVKVEHTEPWWTYSHYCKWCESYIGESEWSKVKEGGDEK